MSESEGRFLEGRIQDSLSTDVRFVSGYGRNVVPLGVPPTVLTLLVTNITETSAISGGNVINNGRMTIIQRGAAWSTSPSPTIDLPTKTIQVGGLGSYLSNITGLTDGTIYYVRAYAVNAAGVGYGNQLTFQTTAGVPLVTTSEPTEISRTTAFSGGNVTFNGGDPVTTRGVCWSTTPNPTIADFITTDGSGSGVFTSSLTGLQPNTTYYVRAYATNSSGTGYGNERIFQTLAQTVATCTTTIASNITSTSATSGGTITDDGGQSVMTRGVCWSTSPNPTTSDFTTTDGTGVGSFISNLTGLMPGQFYYVRAYGTNTIGTGYGNQITFSTNAILPTLTTNAVTGITDTTVTSGGTITSNGGSAILTSGVVVNITINPDLLNNIFLSTDGTSSGSFSSVITELSPGVAYFVRAYATNRIGTSYGNNVSFTTYTIPTVVTTAVTSITDITASGGGNVTSDGGTFVIARGICWNTSGSPTTTDSKTVDGSGIGAFSSSLTGLSSSTTYYVRAYATNSVGTAYGAQTVFATWTVPTVSTFSVTNVASSTLQTGGFVLTTGGASVTSRGVVWDTMENPTLALSLYTINGGGLGGYTSFVSSLSSQTGYYIRAYASNSVGVEYGSTILVSTIGLPIVSTYTAANIASSTILAGGFVISDGGSNITRRGFVWNTGSAHVTYFSTQSGTGNGEFTSTLIGLQSSTGYFLRAFAVNNAGTAFGSVVPFSTITIPSVSSYVISIAGISSIVAGGFVTSEGGGTVISRGFVWNTGPATASFSTQAGSGTGEFTSTLTDLLSSTGYFVRAYATNKAGTTFGSTIPISTIAFPSVSTLQMSTLYATSAFGQGQVIATGGATTTRGLVWNSTPEPTLETGFSTIDGIGLGSYTDMISTLTPLTNYYIRAYGTNAAGTSYGADRIFSTVGTITPGVSSVYLSAVSADVSVTGLVTSEGGAPVTSRGFVWNLSSSVNYISTISGSGPGFFSTTMTGLSSQSSYLVQAFATNEYGITYGSTSEVSTIGELYPFTSFTFTSAGSVGRFGPTLSQCRSSYSLFNWITNPNYFNMSTQGIQIWTVPKTGSYRLTARGGSGGTRFSNGIPTSNLGGSGAIIQGVFTLNQGEKINILVGQAGKSATTSGCGGGGGGTYISKYGISTLSAIYLVSGAGGGSGNDQASYTNGMNASLSTFGSYDRQNIGTPGSNGNGGWSGQYSSSNNTGGGGGGFLTSGVLPANANGSPGSGFLQGGVGGKGGETNEEGGFGGGGSTNPKLNNANQSAGAGGGFSGGAGGNRFTISRVGGGGGGSINNGISQINTVGHTGNGSVFIEYL